MNPLKVALPNRGNVVAGTQKDELSLLHLEYFKICKEFAAMSKETGWEDHLAKWDELFDNCSKKANKLGALVRPPVSPREYQGTSSN